MRAVGRLTPRLRTVFDEAGHGELLEEVEAAAACGAEGPQEGSELWTTRSML